MAILPRRDNFVRAGAVWMRIWTILGLTSFTIGETVTISKLKILHSVFLSFLLVFIAIFRYLVHVPDERGVISSMIELHTSCSSLFASALMILLTVVNQRKGVPVVEGTVALRQRHGLICSRSVLFYFPMTCLVPCLSIVIEKIRVVRSNPNASLFLLVSYCFSVYNYILCAQMSYFLSVAKDGFRTLNERFKKVENISELRRLRLMYHEIFAYTRRILLFFSSRTILIVTHNFAVGVLYMYYGIMELVSPTAHILGLSTWVIFYWSICCFFGVFVTVRPFEKIAKEAHSIAITVQSFSTTPGFAKSFYDELRMFSSQLLLEDVRFDPHDFLSLNYPLLLSMFAAVGSSLAILLQVTMGG